MEKYFFFSGSLCFFLEILNYFFGRDKWNPNSLCNARVFLQKSILKWVIAEFLRAALSVYLLSHFQILLELFNSILSVLHIKKWDQIDTQYMST